MKRLEIGRPRLAAGALIVGGAIAVLAVRAAAPDPVPPPQVAAPAAPVIAPPPPTPTPAPSAGPASADGLRLHGLAGRGAIIGGPGGRQHFYAVGREVRPGLRVARIERDHVLLASVHSQVRLGFDGPAGSLQPASAPAAAPPAGSEAALRDQMLGYRLGLAPRRVGDRTDGFVLRRGAQLPALERAGLRPGDVIVGVNGSGFDEERMLELAWQISHSERTEFEVERNGRRIRLALQGQTS